MTGETKNPLHKFDPSKTYFIFEHRDEENTSRKFSALCMDDREFRSIVQARDKLIEETKLLATGEVDEYSEVTLSRIFLGYIARDLLQDILSTNHLPVGYQASVLLFVSNDAPYLIQLEEDGCNDVDVFMETIKDSGGEVQTFSIQSDPPPTTH